MADPMDYVMHSTADQEASAGQGSQAGPGCPQQWSVPHASAAQAAASAHRGSAPVAREPTAWRAQQAAALRQQALAAQQSQEPFHWQQRLPPPHQLMPTQQHAFPSGFQPPAHPQASASYQPLDYSNPRFHLPMPTLTDPSTHAHQRVRASPGTYHLHIPGASAYTAPPAPYTGPPAPSTYAGPPPGSLPPLANPFRSSGYPADPGSRQQMSALASHQMLHQQPLNADRGHQSRPTLLASANGLGADHRPFEPPATHDGITLDGIPVDATSSALSTYPRETFPPRLDFLSYGGGGASGPDDSRRPAHQDIRRRAAARRHAMSRHAQSPADADSDDEVDELSRDPATMRMLEQTLSNTVRFSDLDESSLRAFQQLRGALSNKLVASRTAVASLQSVKLSDLHDSERSCIICYNDFGVASPEGINETPLRLPECGHVFGDHCIKKWFTESDSCPYCRHKVPAETQLSANSQAIQQFIRSHMTRRGAAARRTTNTYADADLYAFLRLSSALRAPPSAGASDPPPAPPSADLFHIPVDTSERARRPHERHGSIRVSPARPASQASATQHPAQAYPHQTTTDGLRPYLLNRYSDSHVEATAQALSAAQAPPESMAYSIGHPQQPLRPPETFASMMATQPPVPQNSVGYVGHSTERQPVAAVDHPHQSATASNPFAATHGHPGSHVQGGDSPPLRSDL